MTASRLWFCRAVILHLWRLQHRIDVVATRFKFGPRTCRSHANTNDEDEEHTEKDQDPRAEIPRLVFIRSRLAKAQTLSTHRKGGNCGLIISKPKLVRLARIQKPIMYIDSVFLRTELDSVRVISRQRN